MKKTLFSLFLTFSFLCFAKSANADYTSLVYFTGIGCPHCAKVDPVLFKKVVQNEDVLIIEYELYQQRANAPIIMGYSSQTNFGLGIPFLIINNDKAFVGDGEILHQIKNSFAEYKGNKVVLPENKLASFGELNLDELKGAPKIWYKNKIAFKKNGGSSANKEVKNFLFSANVPDGAKKIEPIKIALSGDSVEFENAVEFNGWILQWNK
jgi:thiol-disulfide isomerase/thioredoxin